MTDLTLDSDHELAHALAAFEKATDEVRAATSALDLARKSLEKAEADVTEARKHPRKFKVLVVYNGLERQVPAEADELVKKLLERAIAAFGSLPNPHTLSFFTADGVELDDNKSLRAAGIRPGDKLLLRPSAVKGGVS